MNQGVEKGGGWVKGRWHGFGGKSICICSLERKSIFIHSYAAYRNSLNGWPCQKIPLAFSPYISNLYYPTPSPSPSLQYSNVILLLNKWSLFLCAVFSSLIYTLFTISHCHFFPRDSAPGECYTITASNPPHFIPSTTQTNLLNTLILLLPCILFAFSAPLKTTHCISLHPWPMIPVSCPSIRYSPFSS